MSRWINYSTNFIKKTYSFRNWTSLFYTACLAFIFIGNAKICNWIYWILNVSCSMPSNLFFVLLYKLTVMLFVWLLLSSIIASLVLANTSQKRCMSAADIARRCQGGSLLGFGTALEYETRSYYGGRINEPQKTVTSGTIQLSLFVCSIWYIASFSFGACPEKSRLEFMAATDPKTI